MNERIEHVSSGVAIVEGEVVVPADIPDTNLPPVNEALIHSIEERRKFSRLDQEADNAEEEIHLQADEAKERDERQYQAILDSRAKYDKELDDLADKLGNYELAREHIKISEPVMPEHLQYLVDRDNPNSQVKINEARDAAFVAAEKARVEADESRGIDTQSSEYIARKKADKELRDRPGGPTHY